MGREVWGDIPEYEGLYQASTLGRIKSLGRFRKIKNNAKQWMPEKLLKPSLAKYSTLTLSKNNVVKCFAVHRLVLITFKGEPQNGQECNHIDGNKYNNRLSNLEWVSSSENTLHAYRIGLQKRKRVIE